MLCVTCAAKDSSCPGERAGELRLFLCCERRHVGDRHEKEEDRREGDHHPGSRVGQTWLNRRLQPV